MTSDEVFDDPQDQDGNAAKAGDRLFGKEKIFSGDQRTGSDGNAPRDIPSLHLGTGTKGTPTAEVDIKEGGAQKDAEAIEGDDRPVSSTPNADMTTLSLNDGDTGASKTRDAVEPSDQASAETGPESGPRSFSSPLSAPPDRTAAPDRLSGADGDETKPYYVEPEVVSEPPAEEQPAEKPVDPDQERPDDTRDPADPISITNRAPVALDDMASTSEGAAVTVDVLANDTDVDDGDSLSLSAVSVASGSGKVAIVGGKVQYDPGSAYDHLAVGESATVEVDYTVTDAGGLTDTGRLTLTVKGSNDGPVVATPLDDQAATEDAAFSYTVPASAFDDADTADTLSFSATLADGSALPDWIAFDPATRTFSGTPDNGDVGSIDVRVTATDPHGGSVDDVFALTIANTNDGPDDLKLSSTAVDENAANGTAVGTAAGSDADAGDTLTYSLTDDAGGRFAIDSTTGDITVADGTTLDHEVAASHDVTVRVTDDAGSTHDETFTINVADVNEGPTDLALSNALSLNTDGDTDDYVEAANITDFPTTALSYEITFSSDTIPSGRAVLGSYAVSGESNEFLVMGVPGGDIIIAIGGSNIQTDIATSSLFDGDRHSLSVTWDSSTGSLNVYVDGAAAFSGTHQQGFSLSTGGTFILGQEQDSVGGSFADGQIFDGTIDDVRIWNDVRTSEEIADHAGRSLNDPASEAGLVANWQMTDNGSGGIADLAGGHDFTLAGDAVLIGTDIVAEDAVAGTLVGKVTGSDVDSGDTLTYSLTDDAGGRFTIDSTTGEITVAEADERFALDNASNPFAEIDVGNDARLDFVDIDNDGDLDAFGGSRTGEIHFYENTGSTTAPSFTDHGISQLGFQDLGISSELSFADIDGDGDMDAFVGNGNGTLDYYENTGTATSASFTYVGNNQFGLGDVGDDSSSVFVDLDNDGDLDALVAGEGVDVTYYENTGTASSANFVNQGNAFGFDTPINDAVITTYDFDGDGDQDVAIGLNDGTTDFYQNDGSAASANFSHWGTNLFGITDIGGDSAPTFVDLHDDGALDALIGAGDGTINFFAGQQTFDHEMAASHDVTVQVTDAAGATYDETFTINVGDIDEALTITTANNLITDGGFEDNTIADGNYGVYASYGAWENNTGSVEVWRNHKGPASSGDSHIELDHTGTNEVYQDVDTVNGETYSLSFDHSARPGWDAASNSFEVYWNDTLIDSISVDGTSNGSTVWNNYSYTVTGTGGTDRLWFKEGDADSSGALLDNIVLTDADSLLSVLESAGDLSGVGFISGSDYNGGSALTYSLTDDADGWFSINSSTGEITVVDGDLLDFEAAASHDITVQVTDTWGNSTTETHTISVKDVEEASADITLLSNSASTSTETIVEANASVGTVVGTVSSTNDAGETPTYSLTDDAGGRFAIDTSTGEITIATGELATPAYTLVTGGSSPVDGFSADLFATPDLVDIDNDGDLDLFVGDDTGKMTFYENVGDASNPSFASAVTNPFGFTDVGAEGKPTFADLDNDGDLDALVGNASGKFDYFRNDGTASSPNFTDVGTNLFGLNDIGDIAAPTFVDIDGDGDQDVFAGEWLDGGIHFMENVGTASSPSFAAATFNPFGISGIDGITKTEFIDMDGDGDFDALVGGDDGQTYYLENTGSATNPSFAGVVANPFGITDVGSEARLAFGDLNGDGDLDVVYGNSDGSLGYFENTAGGGGSLDQGSYDVTVEVNGGSGNISSEIFTIDVSGNAPTSGHDTITGTSGDDVLYGGDGNDSITSLAGADTLHGGSGNDTISSGGGADTVYGGDGDDTITSGGGADTVYGGDGDDTITSGGGADTVYGGDGDDTLTDFGGASTLHGGAGDDTFRGGVGNDTFYGDEGADLFIILQGQGNDTVVGGDGGGWTDIIELQDAGGGSNIGDYGSDWTLSLDSGSVEASDTNANDGWLDLTDDASGTITLQDGTEIDFSQVESIQW